MEKIKVAAVCGSLRKGSYNRILMNLAVRYAAESDTDVRELDLREPALPLYDQDIEDAGMPDSVRRLKSAIEESELLLIASPEYNYSISSPLKNAIDWASRGGNSFKGKVGAIFGASTGHYGTVRGQAQLRLSLTAVNVLLLPQPQVLVSDAAQAFTAEGDLKDEKQRSRLHQLVHQSIALVRALKK